MRSPGRTPIPKSHRLLADERRREIRVLIDQNGRVTVEEVARRFGISSVTARADLDTLSESGALVRSHGGAIKPISAAPEHPLTVREGMHREEKLRIAQAAAKLICPSQTIILCTGSTSAELAKEVRRKGIENITVITYALNIAMTLADVSGISLLMLGGFLRQPSGAFVGPHAEEMMQSLHVSHCFMSTVGFDADIGLTTLDIMEARLNSRMIQSAAQVTVLADSSKFGHRSLCLTSDLGPVRRVITDTGAPAADVAKLRSRGIEVILT